jgi:hypothetical protein
MVNNRKALIENPNIHKNRLNILRKIMQYRREGQKKKNNKPETYNHSTHQTKQMVQQFNNEMEMLRIEYKV